MINLTKIDKECRKKMSITFKRILDPTKGDLFHEMCNTYYGVLERKGNNIQLIRRIGDCFWVDNSISIKQFAERVCYGRDISKGPYVLFDSNDIKTVNLYLKRYKEKKENGGDPADGMNDWFF